MDTFSWPVRVNSSEQLKVATIEAQFGEGYKQVSSKGLYDVSESWSLSCNGDRASLLAVRHFLINHVTRTFWWVNPWGEKKRYRVKSDAIRTRFLHGALVEIGFTFEEAFSP